MLVNDPGSEGLLAHTDIIGADGDEMQGCARSPRAREGIGVANPLSEQPVGYSDRLLVLLCHKELVREPSVPHAGQQGNREASARAWSLRCVVIEAGL